MKSASSKSLVAEMARLKIESTYTRLRREIFAKIAVKLPLAVVDDVRIAATEELERRGYHVIARRPSRPDRPSRTTCSRRH